MKFESGSGSGSDFLFSFQTDLGLGLGLSFKGIGNNPYETETEIQIKICDLIGQQFTGHFPDQKHRSVSPSRGNELETNKDFHFLLWWRAISDWARHVPE